MQIQVRTRGVELTGELDAHLNRHLRFALGRFGSSIRSVSVVLADVNGPRGGADAACLLRVNAGPREILIDERGDDLQAAIARAAERAGRSVARQLSLAVTRRRTAAAGRPFSQSQQPTQNR